MPKDPLEANYEELQALPAFKPSQPLGFNPLMAQKKLVNRKPQPHESAIYNDLASSDGHLTQDLPSNTQRNQRSLKLLKSLDKSQIDRLLQTTNNLEQIDNLQRGLMEMVLGFSLSSNPFDSYSWRMPNQLLDRDKEGKPCVTQLACAPLER